MTRSARRRVIAGAVVAFCVSTGGDASSEPLAAPLHVASESTITTDGGSVRRLPPGYFLDAAQWLTLDTEIVRLQGAETVLRAENASLRASADAFAGLTWRAVGVLLGIAVAGGIAAGAYAF